MIWTLNIEQTYWYDDILCHIQMASSHFHLKVKRVKCEHSVCSRGSFVQLLESRNIHISWIWCLFHIFHFHRAKHARKEYKCFQFPLPHLSHCNDQNGNITITINTRQTFNDQTHYPLIAPTGAFYAMMCLLAPTKALYVMNDVLVYMLQLIWIIS